MVVQSTRGAPPLDEVCTRQGAHAGFRLRGEYLPGPPPFPDSPEELEWLGLRESLVVTVVVMPGGLGRVLRTWTRGGLEASDVVELSGEEVARFTASADAHAAWSLAAFAALEASTGTVEFEHEAYAYEEDDSDSLDLHAWRPPRSFRVERSRSHGDIDASRGLLAIYEPLLPPTLGGESAFAAIFPAASSRRA